MANKIKIKANQEITDFNGEVIMYKDSDKPMTVGTQIALVLNGSEGDAIKLDDIARSFYKDEYVELDEADFDEVKTKIKAVDVSKTAGSFTNLIKAAVLRALNSAAIKAADKSLDKAIKTATKE